MGPPPGQGKNPALIIVLVVLVIGAVVGGAILLTSGGDDDEPTAGSTLPGDPGGEVTLPNVTNLPEITVPDISVPDLTVPGGDLGDDSGGAPDNPPSGGDATLSGLADDCYNGNMQSCDDLFMQSDSGSELEDYGDTCGHRFDTSHGFCVNALPNPEPPS
ncbi:MAG TPA: hypothetical protein VGO78_19405 [Acidimicrobiales bacterium]|jgi:hypothetical protein|nr:hypothetical protein [Acidimicrobiales bacterium]